MDNKILLVKISGSRAIEVRPKVLSVGPNRYSDSVFLPGEAAKLEAAVRRACAVVKTAKAAGKPPKRAKS